MKDHIITILLLLAMASAPVWAFWPLVLMGSR